MRLIATEIACDRGGRRVLDGVSFAVEAGEALVVTGPNGAGKSTLLRLIAGFLKPAHGTIALEGGASEASLAEQLHFIGHQDAVKGAMTLFETLRFWARVLGAADDRIEAALEAVDLADLAELPAAYLSAGQRRRLALARLVAVERPIWVLDEPTTAIDARSEARLTAMMNAHGAAGGLIVAATHAPLALDRARSLILSQ
jgi:heme exporter protein A